MLTEIEQFLFGNNTAHDLVKLTKNGNEWKLVITPCTNYSSKKTFIFTDVTEQYEQLLLDQYETLDYPLPIIGFESNKQSNEKWSFCLNASDIEWGFTSKWPTSV